MSLTDIKDNESSKRASNENDYKIRISNEDKELAKKLFPDKSFKEIYDILLSEYQKHQELKARTSELEKELESRRVETYPFFNDMKKDGKCGICGESTWLKSCIGQKNEDGIKSYFHQKCYEDARFEEDPEAYRKGRRLREINTQIAQGQKILKEIDKGTHLADIQELLKQLLYKEISEGKDISGSKLEEMYQLVTDLVDLYGSKIAKPTKNNHRIPTSMPTVLVPKSERQSSETTTSSPSFNAIQTHSKKKDKEEDRPMINGREAIFCPRVGAYRDPAKCEECKTEKPFEYRDCHELRKTGEPEPDPAVEPHY